MRIICHKLIRPTFLKTTLEVIFLLMKYLKFSENHTVSLQFLIHTEVTAVSNAWVTATKSLPTASSCLIVEIRSIVGVKAVV